MISRRIFFLVACVAIGLASPAYAGEKQAQPYTLEQLRSPHTTVALRQKAAQLIAETRQELASVKTSGNDRAINAVESNLDILAFTDNRLRQSLQSNPSPGELLETNAYAERILQGVEDPVEGQLFPPFYDLFANVILGGMSGHAVPGLSERKQNRPMGKSRAKRESTFLYEKGRPDFFSV
jgi:hypothetical protein